MIQSKWIWPSLITVSALLAGTLAFTNSTFGLRPLAALWFLLICPGMAFVRLLPTKEVVVQWTLAIALSLALDALVAAILVYAHLWYPNIALGILIATSLVGVSLQMAPEQSKVARKAHGVSRGAEDNELWYRKAMKSVSNGTINLRSVIRSIPQAISPTISRITRRNNATILLVDSDEIACTSICNAMQATGYKMLCVPSDEDALNGVVEAAPDLILLDIALPGIEGWDILHQIRERSSVPIIILTPKREVAEILHGFDLGADDYLTKPFSYTKLEELVGAVLASSRVVHSSKDMVVSEGLSIDLSRKQVMANGKMVYLTPIEFHLLEVFAQHANRTIPASRLRSELWGSTNRGDERQVRKHVSSLRKKVELDPSKPKHLKTRRGYGYRLE